MLLFLWLFPTGTVSISKGGYSYSKKHSAFLIYDVEQMLNYITAFQRKLLFSAVTLCQTVHIIGLLRLSS